MEERNMIVISHAECTDGLSASWSFHKKYPNAKYYYAIYGNTPPNVDSKDVVILDFSYSKEVLLEMKKKAKSITLLDHHETAMNAVGDLDFCHFDLKKSGAGLAWDFVFPKVRHWLINYVEDRDLWKFELPNSREVNATIQSYPLTFDSLYMLEKQTPTSLAVEGAPIIRYQKQLVADIIKRAKRITFEGYECLSANSSILNSDIGEQLALQSNGLGVIWFINENGDKVVSLRSTEKSQINCAELAKKYDGGGHKRSAGFRIKNYEYKA
jgi:oligoribonuclease NrnB/cAMP/cGMP phosphodiesterase (DHH superfamily)